MIDDNVTLDSMDIQGARECLNLFRQTDSDEHMIDANCCIQSLVLRGCTTENPFNKESEQDLYLSFEKELTALKL